MDTDAIEQLIVTLGTIGSCQERDKLVVRNGHEMHVDRAGLAQWVWRMWYSDGFDREYGHLVHVRDNVIRTCTLLISLHTAREENAVVVMFRANPHLQNYLTRITRALIVCAYHGLVALRTTYGDRVECTTRLDAIIDSFRTQITVNLPHVSADVVRYYDQMRTDVLVVPATTVTTAATTVTTAATSVTAASTAALPDDRRKR